MVEFMRKIVPEAIFRFPAYPPSYAKRSEFLLETALRLLRTSNVKGTEVTVNYGYPASYAQFVNEMSGVNWSKPGSERHFYESGRAFLRSIFRPEIQKALKGITGKKKEKRTKIITSSQLLIILNQYITLNTTILIDELVLKPELEEFTIASIIIALEDLQEDELIDGVQSRGKLAFGGEEADFRRVILRPQGVKEKVSRFDKPSSFFEGMDKEFFEDKPISKELKARLKAEAEEFDRRERLFEEEERRKRKRRRK